MEKNREAEEIRAALAAPFSLAEIHWKPQAVSKDGTKAMAIAYIDARSVMDRLDEVLGIDNWQDAYEIIGDGMSVRCVLAILFPGGTEWIRKEDVGSPSEQPDPGDRMKACFSDALKRAAVKIGVGRYLYQLPVQWVDYDSTTRRFTKKPVMPPQFLPAVQPPVPQNRNGSTADRAPVAAASSTAKSSKPKDGKELLERLQRKDEELARQGAIDRGQFIAAIIEAARQHEMSANIEHWVGPEIDVAIEAARDFEKRSRNG